MRFSVLCWNFSVLYTHCRQTPIGCYMRTEKKNQANSTHRDRETHRTWEIGYSTNQSKENDGKISTCDKFSSTVLLRKTTRKFQQNGFYGIFHLSNIEYTVGLFKEN